MQCVPRNAARSDRRMNRQGIIKRKRDNEGESEKERESKRETDIIHHRETRWRRMSQIETADKKVRLMEDEE